MVEEAASVPTPMATDAKREGLWHRFKRWLIKPEVHQLVTHDNEVYGPEEIEELQMTSQFSRRQIFRLYDIFMGLDVYEQGKLTVNEFFKLPQLSSNPLQERIRCVLHLQDDNECMSFRQFVNHLSVFNPTMSRDAKLRFAFSIYDIDGDGRINRADLVSILRLVVGDMLTDEQLELLAARTMVEHENSRTEQYMNFEEFSKSMVNTDFDTKMSIYF
eukprot:GILK01014278.1.p1 GENE.GILK01014278.1~~GILK01014278.1.p1  ORF type:complete len:217 (-),score=34.82 GILK01014278.1:270-920(-)